MSEVGQGTRGCNQIQATAMRERRRGNQIRLEGEKEKLDRAATRLIREGVGNTEAIFLEVFGRCLLDPALSDAVSARVLYLRANPSKMLDCE